MAGLLLDVLALGVLFFAALEDVRGMQVRNAFPGLLLLVSLARVVIERPPFLLVVTHTAILFVVLYVFWHFNGIGGADVKILSAMALGQGPDIWIVLLLACLIFIIYALVLRKPREALPFVPAIFLGALVVQIFLP